MAHATDVIPKLPEVMGRLGALPEWALEKAMEVVDPDCPGGVLYALPAPRKLYLRLCIGEALVEAARECVEEPSAPARCVCGCFELTRIDSAEPLWRCNDCKRVLNAKAEEVA